MGNGTRRNTMLLAEAFFNFQTTYKKINQVYFMTTFTLMSLGVIGGILGLITIFRSPRMATPSFLYHKVLLATNLIHCLTWFLQLFVNKMFTVAGRGEALRFRDPVSAFYSGVIARVIFSTAGYINLYMTMCISLDRCVGLTKPIAYKRMNQRSVALRLIAVSSALSVIFHSWTPWIENQVISTEKKYMLMTPNGTQFRYETVYTLKTHDPTQYYLDMLIDLKNIYNGIIRLSYPVVLTIVTTVACVAFRKHVNAKLRLLQTSNNTASRRIKKQRRKDSNLFMLMVAVVVLTFIQVVPSEAKRIVKNIYPFNTLQVVEDSNLTIEVRLGALKYMLYGTHLSNMIANFFTAIQRTMTFYLYFSLNAAFRQECKLVFKAITFLLLCKLKLTRIAARFHPSDISRTDNVGVRDSRGMQIANFTTINPRLPSSANVLYRQPSLPSAEKHRDRPNRKRSSSVVEGQIQFVDETTSLLAGRRENRPKFTLETPDITANYCYSEVSEV